MPNRKCALQERQNKIIAKNLFLSKQLKSEDTKKRSKDLQRLSLFFQLSWPSAFPDSLSRFEEVRIGQNVDLSTKARCPVLRAVGSVPFLARGHRSQHMRQCWYHCYQGSLFSKRSNLPELMGTQIPPRRTRRFGFVIFGFLSFRSVAFLNSVSLSLG
jgi:hypothetical protein